MSRDWHIYFTHTGSAYVYACTYWCSVVPARQLARYARTYVEVAGGQRAAASSIRRCIRTLHALPSKNERLFGGSAIDARATRRRGLNSIINVGPARPAAGHAFKF